MKVLQAMVCGESVLSRTMEDLVALSCENQKVGILGGNMVVRSNNGAAGRREAVEQFLKTPFTHIQFLDGDQGFPPDTTARLLARNVDIVGACYRRRGNGYDLMFYPLRPDEGPFSSGIVESTHVPTGVMLVHRRVFEKMGPPWFVYDPSPTHPGQYLSEDTSFCYRARAAGFSVWTDIDLSRQVVHYATVPLRLEQ